MMRCAAQTLAKQGFLRPVGALDGVIFERHLKNLLRKHDPPVTLHANATLSTLNYLCKDKVYDVPVWRHVQHLGDLRNLCAHEKDREPTKDEVGELLTGVSGILRTHLEGPAPCMPCLTLAEPPPAAYEAWFNNSS
jgi:hypothetical protein